MISQGAPSLVRTRTAAEAVIHGLGSWWRNTVLERRGEWSGDARFHLGQARRALDHGDIQRAEREAARALELDHVSPWALVVLGRCALKQGSPREAVLAFSRARDRAPSNRYVVALLAKAESQASG
jgi:predicted Zn-dependent protease